MAFASRLNLAVARVGRCQSPARPHGRAILSAARPDGPEDVVQRVFLDFEVQCALGDVEGARDLGEIAVVRQDRRPDGVALHRVEARHGEGARRPRGRRPPGARSGDLRIFAGAAYPGIYTSIIIGCCW